jgi:hypothetical protein
LHRLGPSPNSSNNLLDKFLRGTDANAPEEQYTREDAPEPGERLRHQVGTKWAPSSSTGNCVGSALPPGADSAIGSNGPHQVPGPGPAPAHRRRPPGDDHARQAPELTAAVPHDGGGARAPEGQSVMSSTTRLPRRTVTEREASTPGSEPIGRGSDSIGRGSGSIGRGSGSIGRGSGSIGRGPGML